MTSWPAPPLNAVYALRDMVVANHSAVAQVGAQVLRTGGNAIDATIAMAAMSWIALPGQCGVGGDAFAVVRHSDGSVITVGGSGFGPDGGEPEFYRERRLTAIPPTGALAVAAPGAIAALATLHEKGATRGLEELWLPAIRAAEKGIACSQRTRENILDFESQLRLDDGMRKVFSRDGRAPQLGERLEWPELANSIRALAADPATLYSGELAERAVKALVASDAPFTGIEWAMAGDALVSPAIEGRYRSYVVHETPMPTPGWMVLQQAAMCDGVLTGLPWLSGEAVDVMARAARRSFRDRLERCASDNEAWRELLQPAFHLDGDTTSTVAIDADGCAVSFIQSLAFTFGSMMTIPGTGIVLNNRLARGAYLTPGHPNEVRPRRRPLHTLNAWIVTDEAGRLRHLGNTPGGDGQVQWNMQLLSHVLDHDLDPQEAVSAPRFTVFPGSDANVVGAPEEVLCEARLSPSTMRHLADAGHNVREIGPWDAGGGALIISLDHQLGCLSGGADPRQDGVVLGD